MQKLTTTNGGTDVRLRVRSPSSAPNGSTDPRLPPTFEEAGRSFEALVLPWGKAAATEPRMYATKVGVDGGNR